jgi:hypothetical protein
MTKKEGMNKAMARTIPNFRISGPPKINLMMAWNQAKSI